MIPHNYFVIVITLILQKFCCHFKRNAVYSKIDDYLKILTDEEVKDFVAINFSQYFKSKGEKQNSKKVTKWLYIFLTISDEVEKYFKYFW